MVLLSHWSNKSMAKADLGVEWGRREEQETIFNTKLRDEKHSAVLKQKQSNTLVI